MTPRIEEIEEDDPPSVLKFLAITFGLGLLSWLIMLMILMGLSRLFF